TRRIAFITSYSYDAFEQSLPHRLDPRRHFALIDKATLRMDDDLLFKRAFVDILVDLAHKEHSARAEWRDSGESGSAFGVSEEDYSNLSLAGKIALNRSALTECEQYLDELWNTTDLQAIVISGRPDSIRWKTNDV